MGLLGALFKPFKKLVKKIGKKVKKVFKKIGKAIGKLGIVGQIGMMFLMPYAAGALGSFFGTAGTLSKWGATLLSKPGIGRAALGHTLNAINTVGTTIGKVYTGVTDTISNAFDTVVNKGREILGVPKAPVSPGTVPSEVAITEGQAIGEGRIVARQENLSKILGDYNEANRQSLFGSPDIRITDTIGKRAEASLLAPEKAVADEAFKNLIANIEGPSLTAPNVEKPNMFKRAGDFVTENIQQGLADATQQAGEKLQAMVTDPVGQITDEVTGRVKETATTKLMETIGLKEPTQEEQAGSFNSPAVVSQIQTDSGINFTNSYAIDAFAKQGNNHLAYGLANTGHVASIFDPQNNPTTNQFMTSYYRAPNVSRQLGVA
jgi:hypothetical protein